MKTIRALAPVGVVCVATALSAGCGAVKRPVLYPNAQLQSTGPTIAQADINDCMEQARLHGVTPEKEGETVGATAEGGAKGAIVGTAVGAAAGDIGRGAAVGAAGGAAGGLVGGIFGSGDPDPVFKRFVERCLSDKGYDVIGWQ